MPVLRFRFVITVCLLALWLPATQHCGLEAAELLMQCGDESAAAHGVAPGESCSGDACEVVESGAYYSSDASLKVCPTDLLVIGGLVCAAPVGLTAAAAFSARPDHPRRQPDWVPAWHFVHCVARLPRAP